MSECRGVIREATRDDSAVLAALFTQLGYPTSNEERTRRLPRVIAASGSKVFVAIDDGVSVVGCAHLGPLSILERDLSAQLLDMVVDATHRRRGVGRSLVGAAERWAPDHGSGVVYVRTNVLRPEAPAFYAGLGYANNKTQFEFRKNLLRPCLPPTLKRDEL
jgi:GNAT superfamily N-acetyltransferase